MAEDDGLRARKKRETRQLISDVATALFIERGFDAVTIAEIAEMANVSKVTVFNYFPRKEDLFFDREQEMRDVACNALARRARGQSPLTVLCDLARELVDGEHPFAKFTDGVSQFWSTVEASPALRARAREMRDEFEADLAAMLADAAGARKDDPAARILAGGVLTGWILAYAEALRRQRRGDAEPKVRATFFKRLERALAIVRNGTKGTPYG
ncbi:TetR/AcrR family transcriptional regulator [Pendulispora rubella]|uniref:TetR/AcrR family transcriptional regulator n=1 Tax=Pendulispora rubella TaxID=2741070 RepID=A0ABZ2L4X1_9BACT